jgi:hypothetical protein
MSISNTANSNYSSMDTQSILKVMKFSMDELHRMGTTLSLSETEKEALQFAYDLLNATRNGMLDAQPKEESQSVIVAKNGTFVRGKSTPIMDRLAPPKQPKKH